MIRAQLWNREQIYILVLRMFEKVTLYLGTGVKIYQIFLRQESNHYSQFFSLSECVQKALTLRIVNFRRHLNPPYFFQFKAPRKKISNPKIWKRKRTNKIAPWLSITRTVNINRNILIITNSNRIKRQIKKALYADPVNCQNCKKTPMGKPRLEGNLSFTD